MKMKKKLKFERRTKITVRTRVVNPTFFMEHFMCDVCFTCVYFNVIFFDCRWPETETESKLTENYEYSVIENPVKERCSVWGERL